MQTSHPDAATDERRQSLELRAFIFLVVVLAPAISVTLVGALGLGIWIVQLIAGPPGPPPG